MQEDPLNMPRDAFEDIMEKINLADSPVGIDARYTHALIITYLRRISDRLDKLETMIPLSAPPPAQAPRPEAPRDP